MVLYCWRTSKTRNPTLLQTSFCFWLDVIILKLPSNLVITLNHIPQTSLVNFQLHQAVLGPFAPSFVIAISHTLLTRPCLKQTRTALSGCCVSAVTTLAKPEDQDGLMVLFSIFLQDVYIYKKIRKRPGILYEKSSFLLSLIVDKLLAQKKKSDQQQKHQKAILSYIFLPTLFKNTLPETNKHLKMDGWNTILSFWGVKRPIFRGKLAVSFTEPGSSFCVKFVPKITRKTYQKAEFLHIWKIQV